MNYEAKAENMPCRDGELVSIIFIVLYRTYKSVKQLTIYMSNQQIGKFDIQTSS